MHRNQNEVEKGLIVDELWLKFGNSDMKIDSFILSLQNFTHASINDCKI
jgi:hypothetical protein